MSYPAFIRPARARVSGPDLRRLAVASAVLVVAACRAAAPAPPLEVRDAWARPADSATVSAAYFVIVNHEAHAVMLASAASPLAESVTLHETMEMGGLMHMMPLDSAQTIAAADSLVLTPGAKHLMVSGLRRTLVAGDSLPLTLTFRDGRVVTAVAVVRAP